MAERSFHDMQSQGVKHVLYNFTVKPQGGTTPPLMGEGDPHSSFVTVIRGASGINGATGETGTYVIQTTNPFLAVVSQIGNLTFTAPQGGYEVSFGTPYQNADGTWTIFFTVYDSGTATDLPLGSAVSMSLVFRNSLAKP
jgi:hypothetical protein